MDAVSLTLLIVTVYGLTLLAYCLIKKGEANLPRILYVNSILLYCLVMISMSFLPLSNGQQKGFNYIPFEKFLTPGGERHIAASFLAALFFVPVGFLSCMECKLRAARHPVLYAVMAGLLISLIIEVVQLYLPFNRICDVDEIFFNVIGTFIGAAVFQIMSDTRGMRRVLRRILYY